MLNLKINLLFLLLLFFSCSSARKIKPSALKEQSEIIEQRRKWRNAQAMIKKEIKEMDREIVKSKNSLLWLEDEFERHSQIIQNTSRMLKRHRRVLEAHEAKRVDQMTMNKQHEALAKEHLRMKNRHYNQVKHYERLMKVILKLEDLRYRREQKKVLPTP